MSGKVGKILEKQPPRPPIFSARMNRAYEAIEGLTRSGVGSGLAEQQLPGGGSQVRAIGVQAAYGIAGPDGITAADWSDLDNIVLGIGLAWIYVRTDGNILKRKAKLEPVENPFEGTVAGGHGPLFLVKVDGVWCLVTFQCP